MHAAHSLSITRQRPPGNRGGDSKGCRRNRPPRADRINRARRLDRDESVEIAHETAPWSVRRRLRARPVAGRSGELQYRHGGAFPKCRRGTPGSDAAILHTLAERITGGQVTSRCTATRGSTAPHRQRQGEPRVRLRRVSRADCSADRYRAERRPGLARAVSDRESTAREELENVVRNFSRSTTASSAGDPRLGMLPGHPPIRVGGLGQADSWKILPHPQHPIYR